MPLKLCEATEGDAPRIGELWRQQFGSSPRIQATFTNLDKLQQFIADIVVDQMRECPGTFWLVVRDGQEICGFASWELNYEDAGSLDYGSDLNYSGVWTLESLSDIVNDEGGEASPNEARNGEVEGDDPEDGEYEQQAEFNAPIGLAREETNPWSVEDDNGDDDHLGDLGGWPIGTNTQLADLWSDMRQSSLWKATLGKSSLWLLYLVTDPRYQRRGVAKAFINWGTQICVQQGIAAFTISPSHTESLFRKSGFNKFDKVTINLDTTGETENLYEESCMLFEPPVLREAKAWAYENDLADELAAFRVSSTIHILLPQRIEQKSWFQGMSGPRLVSVSG